METHPEEGAYEGGVFPIAGKPSPMACGEFWNSEGNITGRKKEKKKKGKKET